MNKLPCWGPKLPCQHVFTIPILMPTSLRGRRRTGMRRRPAYSHTWDAAIPITTHALTMTAPTNHNATPLPRHADSNAG